MDWKSQCIDLEHRYAAELAQRDERESNLRRALVKLTLAADGLDPLLDPHLVSLRDIAKASPGVDAGARLNAITDSLIHSTEKRAVSPSGELDLFQRILDRIHQQEGAAKRLKQLARDMVSNPATVSDDQLDELLVLLSSGKPKEGASGLLGKLFNSNRGEAAGGDGDSTNRVLLGLLEAQSWPGQVTGEIAELEQRLDTAVERDVWIEVVEQLFTLLTGTLGSIQPEIIATEDFLKDLTAKQKQIDQEVNEGHQLREQSYEDVQALNQVVATQTGGIRQGVESAASLGEAKNSVDQRLDAIEGHMSAYIEKEESRQRLAESHEQTLRERLRDVERESMELQAKVVNAHLQATTDSLTGLPNRMAYEERLAQEFARWKRFGEPLTLMMWDVDSFKQINDRFGHKSGDRALVAIGQAMNKRLRETDFIARYGGEEFVVLLPGADMADAEVIAEEIRKGVAGSGFHSGGKRIEVTASCGLSTFKDDDEPDRVFGRADKALYKAKREGKNRFISG